MKGMEPGSIKKAILNLSLRKKFMLSYMVIILFASFVIGGASVSASSAYLKKKIREMSNQLIYHVLLNIDFRSSDFEKVAYHMISDQAFHRVARNQSIYQKQSDTIIDASVMGTVINGVTISDPDIKNIYIQMKNGTIFSWQEGNPKLDINVLDTQHKSTMNWIIDLVQKEPSGMIWEREAESNILFGKKIIDTDDLSTLGYIVYEINPDHFRLSLPYESSVIDPANIAVLNKKNNIIVSAQNPVVKELVSYTLQQQQEGNSLNSKTFRYKKNEYMLVQVSTTYSKWQVICFVPLWNTWKEVAFISYIIIAIIILYIMLAGILAWFLSGSTTRNIHLLQETMKKVEEGNLSVHIQPVSYDEVGMLALRFNYMVGKISDLIQDVSDERLRLQAKEFELLQTQINPHFLYNTLGSIKCIAQLNQQYDIEKMITCLIEILKTALSMKGKNCHLNEELSYVDNYIQLQKIRYANSFTVVYDIAEDTEDLCIVGFILQPLVENALLHGLELNKPDGCITIKSRIVNESLMIWISDNGVGMTAETITAVMTYHENTKKNLNNIGIKNVEERIKYSFGEKYGLRFHSAPGKGTTVEIRLPVLQTAISKT